MKSPTRSATSWAAWCRASTASATKKEYLRESVGETAYGLMAGIKQVFDPKGHPESRQGVQLGIRGSRCCFIRSYG